MSTRRWYTSQALDSYRALDGVINDMTLEEITACLDLEAATKRRRSVIDRLITRAVKLSVIAITNRLQEKYHGQNS